MISESDENIKSDVQIDIQNIIQLYDINNDKKINIIDLLLMKRFILSKRNKPWKSNMQMKIAADINKDGKINIIDLLLLKRKILKQ